MTTHDDISFRYAGTPINFQEKQVYFYVLFEKKIGHFNEIYKYINILIFDIYLYSDMFFIQLSFYM